MSAPPATKSLLPDHLVIGAASLEEGAAWCQRVLGVRPAPGGRHALMGTHNLLLDISSPACPRCYLEIIAIDPTAPAPGRARWFDLDQPAVQTRLASGPGLIHWVARTPDLDATLAQQRALGLDAGPALAASRAAPGGELRWRIAVRDDGARLDGGLLPLLIEWGAVHPTDSLPASGVQLLDLDRSGPRLRARLATALGDVMLEQGA